MLDKLLLLDSDLIYALNVCSFAFLGYVAGRYPFMDKRVERYMGLAASITVLYVLLVGLTVPAVFAGSHFFILGTTLFFSYSFGKMRQYLVGSVLFSGDTDYFKNITVFKKRGKISMPGLGPSEVTLSGDDLRAYVKFVLLFCKPKKLLILGGGAFVQPRYFLEQFGSGIKIDVVEIDKKLAALSEKYFHLSSYKTLSIYLQPCREYIDKQVVRPLYDLVAVDISMGNLYMPRPEGKSVSPFTFTTLDAQEISVYTIESIKKIHNTMATNGILIVNCIGTVEGLGSLLWRSIVSNCKKEFKYVCIFPQHASAPTQRQNIIILAGNQADLSSSKSLKQIVYSAHLHTADKDQLLRLFIDKLYTLKNRIRELHDKDITRWVCFQRTSYE